MGEAVRRLKKEYKELMLNSSNYWTARPKEGDLLTWEANIHGWEDARHHGKDYTLEITYPECYPFRAPKVRFMSSVICENVHTNGLVCLDILGSEWSPAITIYSLMNSLCSVLTDPPVTGYPNKVHGLRSLAPAIVAPAAAPAIVAPIPIAPPRRRRTELELLQI